MRNLCPFCPRPKGLLGQREGLLGQLSQYWALKKCPDSFEHINSETKCGGVGMFISNNMDYSIRNDLSLNTTGCEDLWVEIDFKQAQV